jgi:hypothetical protein
VTPRIDLSLIPVVTDIIHNSTIGHTEIAYELACKFGKVLYITVEEGVG